MESSVKIEESWKAALQAEFASPYMAALKKFLVEEKNSGKQQTAANEFQYILINITLVNLTTPLYLKEYLETKWGTACALNVEPC